jgi:hypothetical protein
MIFLGKRATRWESGEVVMQSVAKLGIDRTFMGMFTSALFGEIILQKYNSDSFDS